MSKTPKQIMGAWGEEQASLFLSRQGYEIIDRNYTIYKNGKKAGEVDIIARHNKHHFGKTLCFIEVKTRSQGDDKDDRAEEATKRKQKFAAFLKTARQYCLDKEIDMDSMPIQFEQVSVYVRKKAGGAAVVFRKFEIPID